MQYYHINPSQTIDEQEFEQFVAQYCADNKLTITLQGSLGKYPGSRHWHFKQDKQKGTLELTLWNKEKQLFFHHSDSRYAEWMDDEIHRFTQAIKAYIQ